MMGTKEGATHMISESLSCPPLLGRFVLMFVTSKIGITKKIFNHSLASQLGGGEVLDPDPAYSSL